MNRSYEKYKNIMVSCLLNCPYDIGIIIISYAVYSEDEYYNNAIKNFPREGVDVTFGRAWFAESTLKIIITPNTTTSMTIALQFDRGWGIDGYSGCHARYNCKPREFFIDPRRAIEICGDVYLNNTHIKLFKVVIEAAIVRLQEIFSKISIFPIEIKFQRYKSYWKKIQHLFVE